MRRSSWSVLHSESGRRGGEVVMTQGLHWRNNTRKCRLDHPDDTRTSLLLGKAAPTASGETPCRSAPLWALTVQIAGTGARRVVPSRDIVGLIQARKGSPV